MNNKKPKSKVRKIIWIGFFLATAVGGIFSIVCNDVQKELVKIESVENWTAYSSTDSRFRVEFPKEPVVESKQIEIPNAGESLDYKEVRAEESKITYAVSHIDFPAKWRLVGSNTLLKKSLAILIEHEAQGQQLIQQELTTHNGLPAINYKVKRGEHEIQGIIILSGTTFYRLTATYLPSMADKVQHSQFVGSFALNAR